MAFKLGSISSYALSSYCCLVMKRLLIAPLKSLVIEREQFSRLQQAHNRNYQYSKVSTITNDFKFARERSVE
tara:strand:+ start:397 stop:612 length:216 start_codon:yes stop_codon:yes gene_type:complete